MRLRYASIAAMATLFAMAACSSHGGRAARARPIFSPNGEILTAGGKDAPKCPEALGGWWDRIAAAHGGVLTRETLVADANSQFDAMDLDHDGFITPSELSEYRAAIEEPAEDEEVLSPEQLQQKAAAAQQRRGPGGRRGANGDPGLQPRHYSQIPADVVDPVMSADKSLSFKVSREDFLYQQTTEIFPNLDKNHDGKLSREEVVSSCPAR